MLKKSIRRTYRLSRPYKHQYLRQKNSGFYEDNQISVNNTAKLSRPNGVPSNPLDERENNQHVQFSLLDVKADYRKTEDFHKGI